MRRLFWLIVLSGAYLWVLTSGRDQFVLEKGKAIYETIAKWIEDADADFQLKNPKAKKKSRRWD
jgi:hypothetical protein